MAGCTKRNPPWATSASIRGARADRSSSSSAETHEPGEARARPRRRERHETPLARELDHALLPHLDELRALLGRQPVETERRLQRDDGRVELEPVEQRQAVVDAVGFEIHLPDRVSLDLEPAASQARHPLAHRKRVDEGLRPEVLMDVDTAHTAALPVARCNASRQAPRASPSSPASPRGS